MLSIINPKSVDEEYAKLRADLFNCKAVKYLSTDIFYRTESEKKDLLLEREQLLVFLATKKLSFNVEDILLPIIEKKEILSVSKCMEVHIPSFDEIRGEV